MLVRRIGWGAQCLVAAGAAVALSAAPASAAQVIDLGIGFSNGTLFVGGTYALSATATGGAMGSAASLPFIPGGVVFEDNGACVGTAKPSYSSSASVNWTPSVVGEHTLTATYEGSRKTIVVNVVPLADGTTSVPAKPGNCLGTGSA
ncbi:hypothetical protein [Nocardia sp. NPDC005825]